MCVCVCVWTQFQCVCVCVCRLRHKLRILQLKPILTAFLRGSIGFHRLRVQSYKTAHFRCQSRLLPILLITNYGSEVPKPPSLGLINLLEWLTTQRNIFLTRSSVCSHKRYYSGTVRRKTYIGQLQEPISQHLYMFSESCPFGFLWRVHHTVMIY